MLINRHRIRCASIAASFVSFLWIGEVALGASAHISFSGNNYNLASVDLTKLNTLIAEAKADPNVVLVIKERTEGLQRGKMDYIVERVRALRIFQVFARAGIDPARISFEGVSTSNAPIQVESKKVANAPKTKMLTSADATADTVSEFVINFSSGSAQLKLLNAERFKTFLGAVGQPNRDAVVIEGYTDSVGNAAYNMALGEFRALSVYERLLREGLPPYRISTQSFGMSQARAADPKDKDAASQMDRRVIVRWTKNATAVAAATAQEQSKPVVEKPTEPVKADEQLAQPEEPEQKKGQSNHFDLVPFAGVLAPGGKLKDNAKSGTTFGLGIGKAFAISPSGEARVTLFASGKSKHEAKQPDRSGPLKIRMINLRADYAFGAGPLRPFIGVGAGSYTWDATIVQPSTTRENTGEQNDFGGNLTLGLDYMLSSQLFLSPEIAAHSIAGEFSETIFTGVLALRWRL